MQLRPGTTLNNGKHRIIKTLGQGGFGITYLAEHTLLRNKFAIKEFFPKTYCDREVSTSRITIGAKSNLELVEKLKRRFVKEASNLASFDHPGIVHVTDIFEENNTAYSIMEFIDGESLSDIIKRKGRLSEEEALHYITIVGKALGHIHDRNMTHFDVKPGNIMVRMKDNMPVLIDFGLSVQYTEEGDMTSTGIGAMSPGFSPIEMYDVSRIQTFSPTTDIYSLAATLFCLITGEIPPRATEIISNKIDFPDYVSKDVAHLIEKSMQPSKTLRPQSVAEFISLLTLGNTEKQKTPENSTLDIPSNVNNAGKQYKEGDLTDEEGDNKTIFVDIYDDEETIHKETQVNIGALRFIDLGLSVKWADRNIGAQSPNKIGHYFDSNSLETNNQVYSWNLKGAMVPNVIQFQELINKCVWRWIENEDFTGYKITGPNGNSIYFRVTGEGSMRNKELELVRYGILWTNESLSQAHKSDSKVLYFSDEIHSLVKYPSYNSRPLRLVTNLSPQDSTYHEIEDSKIENDSKILDNKTVLKIDANDEPEKTIEKIDQSSYVDLGLSVKWCSVAAGTAVYNKNKEKYEYRANDGTVVTLSELIKNQRLPEIKHFEELRTRCKWIFYSKDGIEGWKITGPNGNVLIMPLSKYNRYLSSQCLLPNHPFYFFLNIGRYTRSIERSIPLTGNIWTVKD